MRTAVLRGDQRDREARRTVRHPSDHVALPDWQQANTGLL